MRGESGDIYGKRRSKKRETGQINQGQNLQYLGLCSARNTKRREGGGKEKRRKKKETENNVESVQKERKHTYTPEGWGHSQNATEVQQSRRLRRNTSLCL